MWILAHISPRPSRLLGIALACLLSATGNLAAADTPMPREGTYGATTVALLYHQRDVCDAIAGQVLGHWRQLEGQDPGRSEDVREQQVRDFVLERQLSDLAASRTVADLVEQFLPQAEAENNDEAGSSLRRLFALEKELCDAVALPVAPLGRFEARIRDLLDRIEVEQVELGRLLVVPDEERLAAALEPYLVYIQRAGIEAEGEYLAYLESKKPKPVGPTITDRMHDWYRQAYAPAVAPSKRALNAWLQARQGKNPREVGRACRELSNRVTSLLRDPSRPFASPDPRVEPLLKKAYTDMRNLATACNSGRTREMDEAFRAMHSDLAQVAELLERYQLGP